GANVGGNIVVQPGKQEEIKGLLAERIPMPVDCGMHGWMRGWVGVFSHPYFAITDADGKFQIKNAPVGAHKLMIYHDLGYRLAIKGKEGEPITVKAGDNDLGELKWGG